MVKEDEHRPREPSRQATASAGCARRTRARPRFALAPHRTATSLLRCSASRFSITVATGSLVLRNTQAPPTRSGTRTTAGHSDQSKDAIREPPIPAYNRDSKIDSGLKTDGAREIQLGSLLPMKKGLARKDGMRRPTPEGEWFRLILNALRRCKGDRP